ncbi:MAG: lmo0937 family membrane protein [Silvibacterium sp.]
MFLILALVLILAWVGGLVVFHTAGFLIHLLLLFAVISIVFHFLRGRSSTV